MAFNSDVYLTQFASALKYHYPGNVMAKLCYRLQTILPYVAKVRVTGGGRRDGWGINTYPADDSRFAAETAALITPVGEGYTDAYVTLQNFYTRRFVSSAVLDDSASDATALVRAATKLPESIADEHSFKMARGCWYTGGSYPGALGLTSVSTTTYIINMETNFNFNRIFRGMKVDFKATTGSDVSSGGDQIVSDYSEASCTITVGTAITTTATTRICVQDEVSNTGGSTWLSFAWNSIPTLIGTGNCCNVTVSSHPEYVSKVYDSTGTLTMAKMQKGVDWIEGHGKGRIKSIHASPDEIIKYADIFLGDVRIPHDALSGQVAMGYPQKLAYRGGSMRLIPIEKDHLMPKDEIYFIDWDAIQTYNSAWMKWFEEDGSYLHRNQGYMEYELLFYSRANLGITNRNGCAAITGVTI